MKRLLLSLFVLTTVSFAQTGSNGFSVSTIYKSEKIILQCVPTVLNVYKQKTPLLWGVILLKLLKILVDYDNHQFLKTMIKDLTTT